MEIKTRQEAINIANEIERYEAALKQLKDALKKYVDANGPVDTGDKIWDFTTSTSWSFTPENLKMLATEIFARGFDPWEYLDIDAKAVTKNVMPETELAQYGTAKTTKRFSSRKSAGFAEEEKGVA